MTAQEMAADHELLGVSSDVLPGAVVSTWKGPGWAESSQSDDDVVTFVRSLGSVPDLWGGVQEVELLQRDEIRRTKDAVAIHRQPAHVIVGRAACMDLVAVDQLVELLSSAVRLVGGEQAEAARLRGPQPA